MFAKKRARHERTGSGTPPSIAAAPPPTLLAPSPTRPIAPPLVSPLQMTFDFELDPPGTLSVDPFRPSEDHGVAARPQTSDGLGRGLGLGLGPGDGQQRKSAASPIGLQPPTLPPIPRIASRNASLASSSVSLVSEAEAGARARHESDNVSALSAGSRKSTGIRLMPSRSFEHTAEPLPAAAAARGFESRVELLPT
ncbi:hypothetical protein LTR53_013204, partial [Teratosphaeriaceae sp. CCFEE 6253]